MHKLLILTAASLAAIPPAAGAQAAVGPEASACRASAGQSAILVNVTGLRRPTGFLRVQVHGDDAATWLGDKTHLKRIEVPVTATNMPVCVRVPGPGRYAVAVRHDEDGDRKLTRRDGGGFSGNPRLSVVNLRPSYQQSAFVVPEAGVKRVNVVLNYLFGLSIRPVGRS